MTAKTVLELLDTAPSAHLKQLPDAAIRDLKEIEKQLNLGKCAPKFSAMCEYLQAKHGVSMGRRRLATAAKAAGIKPWWSV